MMGRYDYVLCPAVPGPGEGLVCVRPAFHATDLTRCTGAPGADAGRVDPGLAPSRGLLLTTSGAGLSLRGISRAAGAARACARSPRCVRDLCRRAERDLRTATDPTSLRTALCAGAPTVRRTRGTCLGPLRNECPRAPRRLIRLRVRPPGFPRFCLAIERQYVCTMCAARGCAPWLHAH